MGGLELKRYIYNLNLSGSIYPRGGGHRNRRWRKWIKTRTPKAGRLNNHLHQSVRTVVKPCLSHGSLILSGRIVLPTMGHDALSVQGWLNKMDNYTKWLSAIFDEMNELFPRELQIARINVNRRLRGEEEEWFVTHAFTDSKPKPPG